MIEKGRTFKLKKFGSSWGVTIDKDLREMLGITKDDLKESCFIRTDGLEKVNSKDIEVDEN